ncbi:MAG: recombinase family protein, partial [archaeon]
MKVALYTRVSTEDQAREGTSLEVQSEFLVSYAKREMNEIVEIYVDDGYSGYSMERPALRKLLADAKKKKFEMVLVHKIDRFSRNLRDLLNLVEELELLDISLKSATEAYDTSNSAGKMMFQQLGSFAEFERNRIKERVFPGMIKGVQRGNWQGARYS